MFRSSNCCTDCGAAGPSDPGEPARREDGATGHAGVNLLRNPSRGQAGVTHDDCRVVDEVVDDSYGESGVNFANGARSNVAGGSGH